MIEFRQKQFSEYDAMRQLYVELDKLGLFRNHRVEVISPSALIPVLKGNNVVIEKFTQATRVFGKDRYRMYIKVGAKAKMPDDVRLPQSSYNKSLGTLNLGLNFGFDVDNPNQGKNQERSNQDKKDRDKGKDEGRIETKISSETSSHPSPIFRQKEFGNKNKNNNNGGGGNKFFQVRFNPTVDFLNYQVHELLGDAIKYDKRDRSLVLEFDSVYKAIQALNILPFGIGYKVYLLNS